MNGGKHDCTELLLIVNKSQYNKGTASKNIAGVIAFLDPLNF